ncbi:MAG: hypothetical protein ACKVOW_08155 [Chitinophagaceae bacterium]
MSNYSAKELLKNFFSVLAGVVIAFAILISLAAFLLFADIIPAGHTRTNEQDLLVAEISFAISIIIASVAAGYSTAKISTRQNWLHIIIAGIVFMVFLWYTHEFDFGFSDTWSYTFLLLVLPFTLLGGYFGLRKKNAD